MDNALIPAKEGDGERTSPLFSSQKSHDQVDPLLGAPTTNNITNGGTMTDIGLALPPDEPQVHNHSLLQQQIGDDDDDADDNEHTKLLQNAEQAQSYTVSKLKDHSSSPRLSGRNSGRQWANGQPVSPPGAGGAYGSPRANVSFQEQNNGRAHPERQSITGSLRSTTSENSSSNNNKNNKSSSTRWDWLDKSALAFGARMSICITVSALFTLMGDPLSGSVYPEAMWVLITVLFVCWFPSLDAASVVEKSLQRIYGTLIGATVGLISGFFSLVVLEYTAIKSLQAFFLGLCIFGYTYVICWAAVQFKVEGTNTKIISRYNYACILALLTFYICLMPFFDNTAKCWKKALYRVLNVLIGCVLGAGLSVFVLPRSTVQILNRKIETQIKLAGEASKAVLHHAAEHFSDNAYLPVSLGELVDEVDVTNRRASLMRTTLTMSHRPWRKQHKDDDIMLDAEAALEKQESALQDSRLIKAQLGMLKYDPFQLGTPGAVIGSYRTEVAQTLARALRIQHTVVLLDGIVRNDPKHDFSESHIRLIADIGTLIEKMLSVPLDEVAAEELQLKMAQIRKFIVELASVVSASSSQEVPKDYPSDTTTLRHVGSRHDLVDMVAHDEGFVDLEQDDKSGRGAPKFVHGSRVCALLFLQLVEHLALRSIRLYQSWKNCLHLYHASEYRKTHHASLRHLSSSFRRSFGKE